MYVQVALWHPIGGSWSREPPCGLTTTLRASTTRRQCPMLWSGRLTTWWQLPLALLLSFSTPATCQVPSSLLIRSAYLIMSCLFCTKAVTMCNGSSIVVLLIEHSSCHLPAKLTLQAQNNLAGSFVFPRYNLLILRRGPTQAKQASASRL